jgi:folate-binding protein YgfZ
MLESNGVFNFKLIGEEAYNIYRVEQGNPASPNELNDNVNPHEAGLINYIDFKKGCYIGQEVIARLDTYDKVQRRITGIKFTDAINQTDSFSVYSGASEVGNVTSVVYSPKLKTYLGLAFIRKGFLQDSNSLHAVNSKGEKKSIVIDSLPFIK